MVYYKIINDWLLGGIREMTIRENLSYLKYFGFSLTFWKTLNVVFGKTKGKLAWKIKDINNEKIEKYLKNVCPNSYKLLSFNEKHETIDSNNPLSTMESKQELVNNVIWTMWWQGETDAPELVKACIASMRKYGKGHPVIVIDKNNYTKYIQLPTFIVKKYNNGKLDKTQLQKCVLGNTHLSDIIRLNLLYLYGGVWADASIMFTNYINDNLFSDQWSTLGQDDEWYIGRGKWSTFFMGCQAGNLLIQFVYEMLIEYWKNKNYYVNYLMFDYIIDIAYKENSEIKNMIDTVGTQNKKCLTINRNYYKKVNIQVFEKLLESQQFHKLSWRWWGADKDAKVHLLTEDGTQTWFGYLYEHYIQNMYEK